ncbi:MAG: hypothetical protein COA78_06440 [Blastopirellula sp.]|nr:MAG: hypothetical protein COA78_06440 [Blastopirellula sp.]
MRKHLGTSIKLAVYPACINDVSRIETATISLRRASLILQMLWPIVIDTTQSDGWRQSVCVSIEWIGCGRYNRLQDLSK